MAKAPTATDSIPPLGRPWHEIADELASETDRTRVRKLAEELNSAMDKQES
jgi:hypothetical protein